MAISRILPRNLLIKMRTKSLIRSLAALFVIVILAELLGEALVELADNPILVFIAKPLMMPVLALYYHLSLKGGSRPGWHRYIFAALFFSWLGDLFLMVTWTGENLFLYGLAAFLLAHLMYINGFRMSVAGSPSFLRRMPIAALPVALYTVGLIYGLMRYDNGDLSAMRFPVMLYAGIIMVMVLAALNRNNAVR